jgi:hypothetical protein
MYDDLFETTTGTQSRLIPKAQWHHKAGLTERDEDQDAPDQEE